MKKKRSVKNNLKKSKTRAKLATKEDIRLNE
jgi:hypothetical protein